MFVFLTCCKSCVTLYILTTVKYCDKRLQTVKKCYIVLKHALFKIKNKAKMLNAMDAVSTLYPY